MKTPLVLSVIILTIAAAIGWSDHQRLLTVRTAHDYTVVEAAKRGIFLDPTSKAATVRVTKRERENREATARLLATGYIDFAKEKEVLRNRHAEPDEAFQKRELDFNERMESLDPGQWKILITEVIACKELKNGTRQAFLYNSITTFASRHPQAALAFLADSPDAFEGKGKTEHLISTALVGWTKDDPRAAIEWIRKNNENYSNLVTERTKLDMVTTAALQDPNLAFNLIGELKIQDTSSVIVQLIGFAATPEKRTATLTGLRTYLATIEDEKSREEIATISFMMLSNHVCQEGFNAASQWVASAELSPNELASFAAGLNTQINPRFESAETGRWIEWIGKTLPAAQADQNIRNLVSQWTRQDYEAAGKWLASAAEGPTKNAAIRSYAETIFNHDPETAMQWIKMLPLGTPRDNTLKNIHSNWPKDDPAGKEAFAKEHGIK